MPRATQAKTQAATKPGKAVSFEFYAPLAQSVSIAGTFNQWNSSKNPLKKTNDGKWQGSVQLKPGRYEYRFFVDGHWENDQRPVKCVPNTFGTWNCILEIE